MKTHPANATYAVGRQQLAAAWQRGNIRWHAIAQQLFVVLLVGIFAPGTPLLASPPTPTHPAHAFNILVDDFQPQSEPGGPVYRFNRLGGDRGLLNDSVLSWGTGQMTTTIAPERTWGGAWLSLNHMGSEGLPLNFSALLPAPIKTAYQSQITGLSANIARGTPGRHLRFELKEGNQLRWSSTVTLTGDAQVFSFVLPRPGKLTHLLWVLDQAAAGDQVVVTRVAFTATTPITAPATVAFVWSYGMLLNNWNPATGLVRDKATAVSGAFDAIQATGNLAAATALAAQLGVIERTDAIQIVRRISRTLLVDTPRFHGLWPHFVNVAPTGAISIAPNTEWSSGDTVIAAFGLLTAQRALGLDSSGAEELLRTIDWAHLTAADGMVAQGYAFTGERLGWAWDVFGGESWLVALAYAGATGRSAPIAHPSPPTANGAGFIDELPWLYVSPPTRPDAWGTNWTAYRAAAVARQLAYYPTAHPTACVTRLGLFGLSSAEVPSAPIGTAGTYQAFGVGGQFTAANDGTQALGMPVVTPHYAAMIASLRPQEALGMWTWLIQSGTFSPLSNIESLGFPAGATCDSSAMVWNTLKGSWNLSLQTLGWGRYLVEQTGQRSALWSAAAASPLVQRGYRLLAPNEALPRSAMAKCWRLAVHETPPRSGRIARLSMRSRSTTPQHSAGTSPVCCLNRGLLLPLRSCQMALYG